VATVDATVIVALFNSAHPQHATCMAWFREAIGDGEPLRAPVTALGEVAFAISEGTGDKQLARDVATQVRHSALLELLPVALPLAERAMAIAAEHKISGGGALYLAVAETLGDRLVTLSAELLSKGPGVVETVRPRPG
jgi:predicted nucleic acid-binding protein